MGNGSVVRSEFFQVKICGVVQPADLASIEGAGADAVGLNFVPSSPRRIAPSAAARLSRAVAGRMHRVGVFADQPPDEINAVAAEVELDWVQLHGDEPASVASALHRPYLRVLRPVAGELGETERRVEMWLGTSVPPAAFLIDAYDRRRLGGSGRTADWELARRLVLRFPSVRFVLAGGLTPHNVRRAIELVGPAAVDVASGVESRPGEKDPERLERFVQEARAAWRRPGDPPAPPECFT